MTRKKASALLSRNGNRFGGQIGEKDVNHDDYDDKYIIEVLRDAKTVAMVGASANWNRPSFFAMKYMQQKGFRVIPVNPGVAGKEILGEMTVARLDEIEDPIDMVDIFRNSEAAGQITDDAIKAGAKIVWMQLGVRNDEAAKRAEDAGLRVVMRSLPEDRIRTSLRRAELARHQFARHYQQTAKTGLRSRDMSNRKPGIETLSVHAGTPPDPTTGARQMPIYQTSSFVFDDADHAASLFNLQLPGFIYSRLTNPTVSAMEERIAALEDAAAPPQHLPGTRRRFWRSSL